MSEHDPGNEGLQRVHEIYLATTDEAARTIATGLANFLRIQSARVTSYDVALLLRIQRECIELKSRLNQGEDPSPPT